MLAIPVPFVVSLLLILLAVTLLVHHGKQAKNACIFLFLCAATTAVVGLRWTFDWTLLRLIQPVLASFIPVVAWYSFAQANRATRLSPAHLLGPIMVVVAIIANPLFPTLLDLLLTSIYVLYGVALIRIATQTNRLLLQVSLTQWEWARRAEALAGIMLIFSAIIDTAMSFDFFLNQGNESTYILTAGHLILLPVLSMAVIIVSLNTPLVESAEPDDIVPQDIESDPACLSDEKAHEIVTSLDNLMKEKEVFLDPDLTLSRLSRKLCIPARQLSMAVNQIHQRNISKVINAYRIEKAKHLLLESNETITQILMRSGFQTKSNFNREFARITGKTPSEFRKNNQHQPPFDRQ
jgi:AraC-like DNA-binding protein